MNCIRLLFCLYNFVFLLLGAIVLGCGIWIVADPNFVQHLEKLVEEADQSEKITDSLVTVVKSSGYILIALGGVVFFLSFLGYCGAIKESRCLLGFYTFLLAIILIVEVVAIVLVLAVYGPQLDKQT